MQKIVKIHISHMYESCERHTFYVVVTTDEGFTREVESHQTGSIYTDHEGLTVEEAMDRALITAADWGDFLQLPVEPFIFQDILREPSLTFDSYTMRRELNE